MILNSIQQSILTLCEEKNIYSLSLREIGKLIGVDHPQTVKNNLNQLLQKGIVRVDNINEKVEAVHSGDVSSNSLVSIPILGSANCGPARIFASEEPQGFLKVSPTLLGNIEHSKLFALKAVGSSMNKADIKNNNIENGDYIIIDGSRKTPQNGDYVLSIIDGCANIKKYYKDISNNQIVLHSESYEDIPPIFIHENDLVNYNINGLVVQVLKIPL
jgi:SOS-response transcriptional repressor LexA